LSYDAIVVGSGAAGGWAAKELCEAGLDVLLLDAGPVLDRRTSFPDPPHPRRRLLARVRAGLGGQPVQMRCSVFDARTRRLFVNDRENPYTTKGGSRFNWFRGRQVGGRLHLWARITPRLSDLELRAASRDGQGADWPLSSDQLDPHYDRVEEFLGVERTPLTRAEQAFKQAVEGAFPNREVVGVPAARHDPQPVPRTIRSAEETGRLELRADAVVRSVITDSASGRATGVSFIDRATRRAEQVSANLVVLCASTIETLRIMLNSSSPAHPTGLGNSSGLLGRGLMDHVMTGIGGPLPDAGPPELTADPYDLGAETGFLVPRFRNLGERDRSFLRGYGIQGGIGRGDQWYMYAAGEMLSRPENRVTLDPDRADRWGIPVPRIACIPSSNESAMAADQLDAMKEMAAAAGLEVRTPPSGRLLDSIAFRLWRSRLLAPEGTFLPGSAVQEIGGAPMGKDPRSSVLDEFGRCWDAANVFVTDGASFPSGCWQNITLTIMALTVRSCERIAREYSAGRI
jgi:choline dehydrogenase-like flavoprotein